MCILGESQDLLEHNANAAGETIFSPASHGRLSLSNPLSPSTPPFHCLATVIIVALPSTWFHSRPRLAQLARLGLGLS